MGSELRPAPLPTPQFWGIQDAGWPTGNDTSGNTEVPLGSRPAPSELAQWQPNCPCAPCRGSTWPCWRQGHLYRARCEQGQSHLCDGQAGPPLQDLRVPGRASLYQPHAHPAVSSIFCFWFFQSMYQIQTSFLLLLLTVSPGQWKSTPESILPTPRLPSLFPMIQSLRSGHSYLSMM